MKKEEKKLVNSVSSAENGIDIDAEKNAAFLTSRWLHLR